MSPGSGADGAQATGEGEHAEGWEELGVDAGEAAAGQAIGFGPFEAALAAGDGFTPSFAAHYRAQLRRTAQAWLRSGMGEVEALGWHRAGFGVGEALRWRARGAYPQEAARRAAGFSWSRGEGEGNG